jgi:bromodomain and PHD finger-containing protein 1
VNQERAKRNLRPVIEEEFELLIDRLEKESHFQALVNGDDLGQSIDEDALCVICLDGECSNCNAILFCDMCNMAVHQECYGVPYVPEGKTEMTDARVCKLFDNSIAI